MAARTSSFVLAAAAAAFALTASVAADARAASSALESARFSLTIDGVEIAAFSQLDQSVPGRLVLERGATTRSRSLAAWHQAVLLGDIAGARKGGAIVVYDYEGSPIKRYRLQNAWPSKLEIGALSADGVEVSVESITLCHEGFEIR